MEYSGTWVLGSSIQRSYVLICYMIITIRLLLVTHHEPIHMSYLNDGFIGLIWIKMSRPTFDCVMPAREWKMQSARHMDSCNHLKFQNGLGVQYQWTLSHISRKHMQVLMQLQ